MDAKSSQLKNESKSEDFSASGDAEESVNGTAINAFDVRLMVQLRVHLIMHLELHVKLHFKIYIKVHKKGFSWDWTKRCYWVALVHAIVNA